ncbi:MAG: Tll0287-like domain-containing protein [Candidatus Wenzhouxiangella sp. M2_3B_020]
MSPRRLVPALLLVSAGAAGGDPPEWVEDARGAASQLARQLKSELVSAIGAGGPPAGIETCRERAPEIADELSGGKLAVGRTALQYRNPGNAPEPWEEKVLRDFRERMDAGADPASLETWNVVSRDGQRIGRWMKAIPMQPQCTVCHGNAVPDAVADAVSRLYPEDRATGFEVGDLRGAFTVEIELDPAAPKNEFGSDIGHASAGRD